MSMNEEAGLLAAVEALGESKNARRFDAELKRRVVRYTRARLREGASLKDVSKAIDVSMPSLERFLEQVPELVPVEIVESLEPPAVPACVEPSAAAAPAPRRSLTVYGPRGLRVEGLGVEDVAALFERMSSCSA